MTQIKGFMNTRLIDFSRYFFRRFGIVGSTIGCFHSYGRSSLVIVAVGLIGGMLPFGSIASVPVWTYGSQNYPSQAAALAAMHAVSPAKAQLTVMSGVSSINAATVTYKYTAPDKSGTKGSFYYCPSEDHGSCGNQTTSQSQALAHAVNAVAWGMEDTMVPAQYHSCMVTATTLTGGWVQTAFDMSDVQWYNITWNDGNCATYAPSPPHGNQLGVTRYYTYICPAYYSAGFKQYWESNSGTPTCIDYDSDVISSRLLECPESGSPATLVGDPCDVSSGDFSQTETDYTAPWLSFSRYYHSATLESFHTLGVGWTHNFAASLILDASGQPIGIIRPNGHQDAVYNLQGYGSTYTSLSGASVHLNFVNYSWVATRKDGSNEVYDTTGKLLQMVSAGGMVITLNYNNISQLVSVSDPFGHVLQFSYNSNAQLQTVTDPAGKKITYLYDAKSNLTSVTYQDNAVRRYVYENSTFPNNLTGIFDENNSRFLTIAYDATTGAVISSQQAGGVAAVSISYGTTTATVTEPLGAVSTYTFTTESIVAPRINAISRNGLNVAFAVPSESVDNQRRVTQITDASGNVTKYTYNIDHLTSMTEAYGTSRARTTSFPSYLAPNSQLPTIVIEPQLQTSYAYYVGTNNIQSKSVTDLTVTPNVNRIWTYSYDSNGQLLTIDGPRTDVTDTVTYSYWNCTTSGYCGQIHTITDALGHKTTLNHANQHGQPTSIVDANNVTTTVTYDNRLRVLTRTFGTLLTQYSYWPTGLLHTVTLPDGTTITFGYDGAHRLTDITDAGGDHVHYVLDAMGNHVEEDIYNSSSTLKRKRYQSFNALNQLWKAVMSTNTAAVTTTFLYDNNGNVTDVEGPLNRNVHNVFDELNRLTIRTDPASGLTQMSFDAAGNLASVIDPRNLTTTYTYNGFGEIASMVSPDTAHTATTYDLVGNVLTTTDARGATASFSYDALNRKTQVSYGDQTITFTYDAGTDGVGRLTGASDSNHSLSLTYDPNGNITKKTQIVSGITRTVSYAYLNGQLSSIVTPSGQTVAFGRSNSRINAVTVNGSSVVSSILYDPFGPATSTTWSNSSIQTKTYDLDGRPNQIVSPTASSNVTNVYTVDNASRITNITDSGTASISEAFAYDPLDRVTSGATSTKSSIYVYDANGNRTQQTGSSSYTNQVSTSSNKINSTSGALTRNYSYDAAGNTTGYTGATFTFNNRGRMSSAVTSAGTTNYVYNALGQMIEKSGNGGTTLIVYDEYGHVLGEYSGTGALIQETVWADDVPVATIRPNGSAVSVYYVLTDHLGTPRKIEGPLSNTLVWRWDPDTFGAQVSAGQTISYNLRYPGQLYLPETGLSNNYFRTYDPQMGRYLESDPNGLAGGVSTYAFVGGNSLSNSDPFGRSCLNGGVMTTCDYPGGPMFIVPSSSNFPAYIDPDRIDDAFLYHSYDVQRSLADFDCVTDDMAFAQMESNPTPGHPNPATVEGAKNNARVSVLDNPVTSYLTTDLRTGQPLVVNMTGLGSKFRPGYVAREVTNGVMHSYGEGLNPAQSPFLLGPLVQYLADDFVWGTQMSKLIQKAAGNCECNN